MDHQLLGRFGHQGQGCSESGSRISPIMAPLPSASASTSASASSIAYPTLFEAQPDAQPAADAMLELSRTIDTTSTSTPGAPLRDHLVRANSSRKRTAQSPLLHRLHPTPGHQSRVHNSFHDARVTLTAPKTSCYLSENQKITDRESSHGASSQEQLELEAKFRNAKISDWIDSVKVHRSVSLPAEKYHDRRHRASVPVRQIKQKQIATNDASSDSDKENVEPSQLPSPMLPLHQLAQKYQQRIPNQTEKLSQGPVHSLTPSALFLLPPRRKIRRTTTSPDITHSNGPSQAFEIAEDSPSPPASPKPEDNPRQLTPDVTPYRKANAPKRPRCNSYYDHDILASMTSSTSGVSPQSKWSVKGKGKNEARLNGRQVLGEHPLNGEITKSVPFIEEAEGARFLGL